MNEARRVLQHRQHELNSLFDGWDWMENSGWGWALLIHVHTHLMAFLHFLQENPWLLKYSAAGLWLKTLWNDWNSEHGPGYQKCMGRYVCLLVWLCAWVSLFLHLAIYRFYAHNYCTTLSAASRKPASTCLQRVWKMMFVSDITLGVFHVRVVPSVVGTPNSEPT